MRGGQKQNQKNLLGRGGKKKGCGENEFPPRPRSRRRRNFLEKREKIARPIDKDFDSATITLLRYISNLFIKIMPRKKISPNENKREKFLRLATQRTKEVLSRLRILGNCAHRSVYDYNEDDIDKIFSAIKDQIKNTEAKFHFPKHKEFKL